MIFTLTHPRFSRRGAAALVHALIAITTVLGLMQFATSGRVAYTMDSLTYRDAALNFIVGHPMQATNVMAQTPEFVPLLMWPPAYPALWASVMSLGDINVDHAPSLLNTTLLMLTTLTIYWVCWMVTGSPAVAGVVAVVNAFTPTNMVVYGHAWSETLFIPLLLLAYATFWKYRISQGKFIWLAAAAIFIGIANWVRYAGVAFLPILGVSVMVASSTGFGKRILHSTGAMLLGVSLVFPLWLRNWQLAGNISGSTRGGAPRVDRWLEDAQIIIELFEHSYFAFSMVLSANLEVPILLAVAFVTYKAFRQHGVQWLRPPEIWLPLIWMMGYLLFLLYARSIQTTVDLDLRMIAIAFPFLLLAMAPAIHAAFSDRALHLTKVLLALLLGLLINSGMQQAYKIHENYAVGGVPRWRATFGLGYRDMRNTSLTSRAIIENMGPVSQSTHILTDYRALYIRYLTRAKAYSPNGDDCSAWRRTGNVEPGILYIGAAESPAWAIDCLKDPSQWRAILPAGRAAPSMYAD